MPTIAVSNEIKRKLNEIKNNENYKSVNEILEKMIVFYEKTNFLNASKLFKKKMKEKNLTLGDLIDQKDFNLIFFGE
ncbi:MAG: hypothetical protein ACTSO9_09315 [Candidatus Helarchaeota archaeon]